MKSSGPLQPWGSGHTQMLQPYTHYQTQDEVPSKCGRLLLPCRLFLPACSSTPTLQVQDDITAGLSTLSSALAPVCRLRYQSLPGLTPSEPLGVFMSLSDCLFPFCTPPTPDSRRKLERKTRFGRKGHFRAQHRPSSTFF